MNATKTKLPTVCFYGLYCYPVFNPDIPGIIGGWEVRMAMIARELARQGLFDVTVIVADYGQPHIEYRDGVRLLSWIGKPGNNLTPATPAQVAVSEEEPKLSEEASVIPQIQQQPSLVGETIASRAVGSSRSLYRGMWDKFGRNFISIRLKKTIGHLARGWYSNVKELFHGNLSLWRAIYATLLDIARLFYGILKSFYAMLRVNLRGVKRAFVIVKEAIGIARRFYSSLDTEGHFVVWKDGVDIFVEADADIYVVFGNHSISAVVANYCAKTKKKYIFSAGSEYDYYPEYATAPYERDMYGETYFEKNYAIKNASLHIVQTPKQARMLKDGFGKNSVIVRNPIDLSSLVPRKENPDYVLWVGKSDERIKRPSLVLELARRMPHIPFVIVMNRSISETYDLREAEARLLPNVTLIESVPYEEIENIFASARLFVSTSVFEGFPNTFLQAAKYGIPVIATDIDPGEMLTIHRAGITCGGDFEQFVKNVQLVLNDAVLYSELSANALRYVRENHEKQAVITQYANALMSVLA